MNIGKYRGNRILRNRALRNYISTWVLRKRVLHLVVLWMVIVGASACTEPISADGSIPDVIDEQDASVDADVGLDSDSQNFKQPANESAPTVTITSPADGESVAGDSFMVTGTASDDSGLATVFVKVGPNSEQLATSTDGYNNWSFESPIPVGDFTIKVIAYDSDGKASEPAIISVDGRSANNDSSAPTVSIDTPVDGSSPLQTVVVLQGTTSDDIGVVSMELTLNGEQLDEREFRTSDNFNIWSRRVPLIPGEANHLKVTATDGASNIGTNEITLYGRSQPDGERPEVTITSPSAGGTINTGTITVTGEASDNLAVRGVKIRTGPKPSGGCQDRQSVDWIDYVKATSTDGFVSWEADVMIDPGAQCIEARAIDISGIAQSQIIEVNNNYVKKWTEDELFFMRLDPFGIPPLVNMTLSKTGVAEVINESIQKATVVSQLDPSAVLTNSLQQIRTACGTCWQGDSSTPNERTGGSYTCENVEDYNCRLTDLGCRFGDENNGCAGWEDSPEYAMVRLLTLTPANADLSGTSLGELQNLLGDVTRSYLSELLAETLQIGPNQSVVSIAGVSQALLDDVIGTHPNTVFDASAPNTPLLEVTLYDVLNDLAPLAESYGPVGEHPGIMDPQHPPFGKIFPDDTFQMILVGESNLRYHDAVDLAKGKDYLGLVEDDTGPTYDDVIEFDFQSEERFQIVGLPPNPVLDLTFSIYETDRDIPVCEGDSPEEQGIDECDTNRPETPYGTNYVWSLDPWNLEYILADAGYQTGYNTLHNYVEKPFTVFGIPVLTTYVYVGDAGGQRSAPGGWSEYAVDGFGAFIVPPLPPQQFLAETIMDLAEVIGHRNVGGPGGCPRADYQICEGDLNVSFELRDIPTGLTAEQLEEDSREFLQQQRAELGQRLLGDFQQNNGCVDVYYDSLGGKEMLLYAIADDPRPTSSCPAPIIDGAGFYADENLTEKLSSTSVSGVSDTAHEKYVLSEGNHTIYAQGADGNTYRLKLDVPNLNQSTEFTIAIARKVR